MPRRYADFDDLPPRRRRETIMERQLRKSRGEEVDDTIDDFMDEDDYDDDYAMSSLERPGGLPRPHYSYRSSGGGCARATLYLVLGTLATLLILLVFLRDTVSNITAPFTGGMPSLPVLIASPTPTIRLNAAAVIRRIQELNRLETTSYTVEKVIETGIEGNAFENFFFGDRLLLIAHGRVIAGIDLARLTEDDVTLSVDGTTMTVQLPPAEIFDVTLDNDKTRVYDRQQGWLASANKDLETQARMAAEEEIFRAACEDGIMQRAHDDSQRVMGQFVELLDINAEVVIDPPPIPTCPAVMP